MISKWTSRKATVCSTLLAGRTPSLAVQEADIPCTSLLTSDHRKRNGL
jgi:hypothetical protein